MHFYRLEEDGSRSAPPAAADLGPMLDAAPAHIGRTPGYTDGHCVLVAPAHEGQFVGDAPNNTHIATGQSGPWLPPKAANRASLRRFESPARSGVLDPQMTSTFGHGWAPTCSTRGGRRGPALANDTNR